MKHLIVIASLLTLASPARAEDAKLASKQHVAAAKSLHAQHRYREAVGELETAYALEPDPQLLFALGQLHVQLGRCGRAVVFYTRFLASRPRREQAAIAREAIGACKNAPEPPKIVVETAPPSPLVSLPRAPDSQRSRTRDVPAPRSARPWYGNYLADGFVVAGVVSAIGSIIAYRAAVSDQESANRAVTYDEQRQYVDRARTRRTVSIALGVGGGVAIAGGGLGIALQRRF